MKKFKILNSKKIKLLLLMSLVLSLTLGAYLYTGKEINLEVDGKEVEAVSYSKTIGEFLEKEEVDFQEGAYINLPLDTEIEDNLDIKIINPITYMVKEKDNIKRIKSIHTKVEDVLEDSGVKLEDKDYVEPSLASELKEDETINIFRVREEVEVKESDIPFEKQVEKTDKLFKGEEKLKQKGVKGVKETHIKKRYVNDEFINDEIVKEEITKEKQDHIVLVGNKEKPKPKPKPKAKVKAKPEETASRSSNTSRMKSSPSKESTSKTSSSKTSSKKTNSAPSKNTSVNSSKTIVMNASAYDLSYESTGKRPGDRGYGITASGMQAGPGVVAVDPRVIPLGTKLYIESMDGTADYGHAVAGDTGGAIKGNKIDLFFGSRAAVRQFGRRNVRVKILK